MTDRIAEIRARISKLQDLPWSYELVQETMRQHHVKDTRGYTVAVPVHANVATQRAMEFIASAPTVLAWLCGEVERLRGTVGRAAELLIRYENNTIHPVTGTGDCIDEISAALRGGAKP